MRNFQIYFSGKQSVLRRNVILRFRLIFTRETTSCRLSSPTYSGTYRRLSILDKFANSIFSRTKSS